jgi:hypothetical protein
MRGAVYQNVISDDEACRNILEKATVSGVINDAGKQRITQNNQRMRKDMFELMFSPD